MKGKTPNLKLKIQARAKKQHYTQRGMYEGRKEKWLEKRGNGRKREGLELSVCFQKWLKARTRKSKEKE